MIIGRLLQRAELQPLITMLGLSVVALFAYMAHEIASGRDWSFDRQILLALRRPGQPQKPIGPLWLEQSAIDLSALGGFTLMWLISLALTILFLLERRYTDALLFTVSVVGSSVLNAGVKWIVKRPRPFVVPHLAYVSNASFPSGHAMLSATVYLTLAALTAHTLPAHVLRSYVVGVTIFIVLMIGCSRVYLGVHWPSDVLAGWCLGAAWALAFTFIAALHPQAAPKTALEALGRKGEAVPAAIAGAAARIAAPAAGRTPTAP